MKLHYLLLAISFLHSPLAGFSQTTPEPATIAQLVTVQVNPAEGFGTPGGTGVIIAKDGNTYFVLTNHHVACLRTAEPASCKLAGTIVTHKKQKYQVASIETFQAKTNEPDLAIVKFTSNDPYPVAVIGDSNQLKVGVDIFVYGFPAVGNKVAEERDGRLTKGYIVGFDSNPKNGYGLSYDARTWWGSSGSPLFDVDGRLIAIHGETETSTSPIEGKEVQTGINKGIPINVFKTKWKTKQRSVQLAVNTEPTKAVVPNFDNPSDAETLYKRGVISHHKGDRKGALMDFDRAIELNPNFAEALNNRGLVKFSLGDKQGAIRDYNKAIKINPNFALAYSNRGLVKFHMGDKQGAIKDYNKALLINPNLRVNHAIRGLVKFDLGDKRFCCTKGKGINIKTPKFGGCKLDCKGSQKDN